VISNFCITVFLGWEFLTAMIHYPENKVGVVDFANAQGLVMFALKFYQSVGFCKIYYSHFIFEVITFLSKIQNHSKKLSNYGSISKI
jgi:hypothetical protein